MALSYINNKEIKFGSSKPLNGVYTPGSPTREYEPLDSLGIYLNSGIPLSYGVENGRYMSMSDEFAATSQGNSYSFNQLFAAQMMLGFKLHDRFIACDTEHKIIGTEPLLHKAYLAEITEKTLDYFKIKIYEEKTRTFCIRMSSSEVPTSYVDLTNSFDENGLNLTQTDRQSFLSYYRFYPLTARDPSSRVEETLGVDYYLLPSAEGLKELSGDILSKFNTFISSDGTLTSLGNTAFAYAGDVGYVPNYRGETSEAAVSAAKKAEVILGRVEEMHADINQILPEMEENLKLTKQYRDEAMSTEIGTVREDVNQLKGDLTELENGLGYSETISDNRFDISKSKDGKNISSNGSLIDNSDYCVSDLCYVGNIESFNIWQYGKTWSPQETYYNLYDENKNRINQSRLTTVKTGNQTNGAFYVEYAFSLIHKNDTMLIDSTKTPTSYIPYHFSKNYFDNVKTWVKDFAKGIYNYITVATDGSGDYVSLRSACESITDATEDNPYVILIKEGTYDVFSDFTDVELKTESNKGFYIPNYVDLVGVGDRDKTIIVGQLEPEQGYAYSTLSPINLNQVHCLKNITVKSINCRYAVHDDPSTSNIKIKRYVENCVFIKEVGAGVGTGLTIAYGSGHRSGADIEFVNCDFSSAIGCGYVIHNNTSFDEPSKLKFNGCNFHTDRGSQPSISFRTISVDYTDYVTIQGCSAERVEFKEEGSGVGLGCCFDVRGYANDLGTITVTGTTNKSIIETNGILKTVIVTN